MIALLYTLYQRRRGATLSEIVRLRRPRSGSSCDSALHTKGMAGLPIYRETRFSVRSSNHAQPMSTTHLPPVPPQVAERFHKENPYISSRWKSSHPPVPPKSLATTKTKVRQTWLADATPPLRSLELPVNPQTTMTNTHRTVGQIKSAPLITAREAFPRDGEPGRGPNASQSPEDRWSWTNLEAPATPRLRPPERSSATSLARFMHIKTWNRTQPESLQEDERPITALPAIRPTLKNQASVPRLAPILPRKLSKQRAASARVGGFGSAIRHQLGNKTPGPASPASVPR